MNNQSDKMVASVLASWAVDGKVLKDLQSLLKPRLTGLSSAIYKHASETRNMSTPTYEFRDFDLLQCQDPFEAVVVIVREHVESLGRFFTGFEGAGDGIRVHLSGKYSTIRFNITHQMLRECGTVEDILDHPNVARSIKLVLEENDGPPF